MYSQLKEVWTALTAPGAQFEIEEIIVRGNPTRNYALAPGSLRELWLASSAYAEREYLIYQDERWTYAQAHEQVASIANWLVMQGVESGDKVAIAMRNYPEWMLCYWAITSIGATVVGMNAWWVKSEMEYALDDSKPRVLILDAERFERVQEHVGRFNMLGVRMEDTPGVTPYASALQTEGELPEVEVDPDSDACIFYTSGTTGKPKGAQLTHRGCVANVMSIAFWGATQTALGVRKGLIEADAEPVIPVSLVTTPLFHVTANNCVAQGTTLAGGKLIHLYRWDAGEALRLIEKECVTGLTGVPVMAREVIAHPDFSSTDTSSLLSLGGGGAQLQPDLVGKIDESVKSARPNTGFGMTETCGIVTSISGDFFVDKPASCGPAMPCYEAKCVNSDGQSVPVGETGELWVRGAQVIRGYLNRDKETAEDIVDGWLKTGDVARIDSDGFIFIVDRLKDMVLRGGENVYCAEVESAIFQHEAVAECSVFGVPDDRLGEEVGAAVYCKRGKTVTADELRSFCQPFIARHKIPRYFWFMDKALPRNANGKFLKRQLRESLEIEAAS